MNFLSFHQLFQWIKSEKQVSACLSAAAAGKFPMEIEGCEGPVSALLLAGIFSANKGLYFVIVSSESDAADLAGDLAITGLPCLRFPMWGTAPYRELSAHSAVFAQRSKILCELTQQKQCIVIIPQRAFLSPLPPPDYIKSLIIALKQGQKIDSAALARTLTLYGYSRVPRVQIHGEFALRGEVLDIHLGDDVFNQTECAYRILFDFDRVESIKRFDPLDQGLIPASVGQGREQIPVLRIHPQRELVWTDERIDALSGYLALCEEFPDGGKAVIEELITRRRVEGEEMFFSLAFAGAGGNAQSSLLDYLGNEGTLVLFEPDRLVNAQDKLAQEFQGMYFLSERACAQHNRGRYPLPKRLLLNFMDLTEPCKRIITFTGTNCLKTVDANPANSIVEAVKIMHTKPEDSFIAMSKGQRSKAAPAFCRFSISCEPARSFFGNINYLKDEIAALSSNGWRIIVSAESAVQAERIWMILAGAEQRLSILPEPFSVGFSLPGIKLMVIQENEIFGRRKRLPRSLKTARSSPIETFVELNPGDYVVHINYGIGLFKGIERIKTEKFERDYIQIEYAGNETVFIPVEQVNMVQRYIGNDGHSPRLDIIGSKTWEKRKNKVKQSVLEFAEKLIKLYSKRKQSQGFAFPKDSDWQTMFEAAFPFEETADQLRCVQEIKQDMESPSPMDRLVCGDVGFGKTEVALRACFKAIMGGKQAVFIAPTTILVEQHYDNFYERFTNFPVKIAMLSRFVSWKNTKKILERLKNGDIDLLVGTHRAVQRDVQFKNLGLIIIDEEQRFGVKDKERLKELKTNVDCLTLSATPIPRTLHMSLLKIKDMSRLLTPPSGRHPIETIVEEYSDERLVKALRSETERGGQVFYLHNRIGTLHETRMRIERLLPELLVETAHGRMESFELEDLMHRFVKGGFHVLVSTTIIENGIDIPNVNTIIIDDADMYGVSQLYQLRGRVGRSDRMAYAYLLYPPNKAITESAMKRLQVVSDCTELGSGFKIALKDMELRGTGNLLGREQSGDIFSVGLDLYLKLLDEAVKHLEDSKYEAETEPLLELEYSGYIPDGYIDSMQEKMEIYKMIAAVNGKDDLEQVYAKLQDRFGSMPDEAASLLALAEIRIICRELNVSVLREKKGIVQIEFAKVSKVKVDRLLRLMQESSGKVTLDSKKPNVLILAAGNIGLREKSEFIREKLAALV